MGTGDKNYIFTNINLTNSERLKLTFISKT